MEFARGIDWACFETIRALPPSKFRRDGYQDFEL